MTRNSWCYGDSGRCANCWLGKQPVNFSLRLVAITLLGLLLLAATAVADTPAIDAAKKLDAKSSEKTQSSSKNNQSAVANTSAAAKTKDAAKEVSDLNQEADSDSKESKSSTAKEGPVAPLSNRSIVYGLVWSTVKVDGLEEANPLAIRFSGVRRLPKSLAVDFQLLIGPAAVSQDQNFFDVPITVKTQIVGAGVLRLQKYFTPFQESLPNFQAILNLGYCYCVIKSTRPVPVEGEDFTYRLPFKAIDRGSFTYGAALHYRLDRKNAITLEFDRFVNDDRLEFAGLTFGWDRAF